MRGSTFLRAQRPPTGSPVPRSADDLAFELDGAPDPHAVLMQTFADAKRDPDDGHHADRAIAAAMWLLSSLPNGPTVLDGPNREAPPLDAKLRRAARTALLAVARMDAAEGRIHEAESTRALIGRLAERGDALYVFLGAGLAALGAVVLIVNRWQEKRGL